MAEKASKGVIVVGDNKEVGERVDYKQVGGVYALSEKRKGW